MFKLNFKRHKKAKDLMHVAAMLLAILVITLTFTVKNKSLFQGFILNENLQVVSTEYSGNKIGIGPTTLEKGKDLTVILELSNKNYRDVRLTAIKQGQNYKEDIYIYCTENNTENPCIDIKSTTLNGPTKLEIKWDSSNAPTGKYHIQVSLLTTTEQNGVGFTFFSSRDFEIVESKPPVSSNRNCANYFVDMDHDHPLCEEATFLHDRGILLGQNIRGYRYANLNEYMNRAEYFAVATRLYNVAPYGNDNYSDLLRFRDITPAVIQDTSRNGWWMEAILSLDGIVKGYSDGTLRPTQSITMAELAKVTALSTGFVQFYDDNRNPWYADIVNAYRSNGIFFEPKVAAKRADATKLIYDTITLIETSDHYQSNNNNWNYNF